MSLAAETACEKTWQKRDGHKKRFRECLSGWQAEFPIIPSFSEDPPILSKQLGREWSCCPECLLIEHRCRTDVAIKHFSGINS